MACMPPISFSRQARILGGLDRTLQKSKRDAYNDSMISTLPKPHAAQTCMRGRTSDEARLGGPSAGPSDEARARNAVQAQARSAAQHRRCVLGKDRKRPAAPFSPFSPTKTQCPVACEARSRILTLCHRFQHRKHQTKDFFERFERFLFRTTQNYIRTCG